MLAAESIPNNLTPEQRAALLAALADEERAIQRQFKPLATIREDEVGKLENRLSDFVKTAWPIIEPGTPYLHNWHIDVIAEYLKAVRDGQIKRLVVNIPPRYMKSILISVMFPCWWWATDPAMRFMFASYSGDLAKAHSINRRTIIQSEWYRALWEYDRKTKLPATMLAIAQDKKLVNFKLGHMLATSILGSVTGFGGNCLIIDDPHKVLEAQSKTEREKVVAFVDQTLSTRLDDKKKGSIILVMQRLNDEDASGVMLKRAGWEHLKIEAVAEKTTTYILPVSKTKLIRPAGHILWKDREGEKEIQQQRETLGSYGFSGQYQQRPSPEEGGILKRVWFEKARYGSLPTRANGTLDLDYIAQSWDATFEAADTCDYVVGQVWGVKGPDLYLIKQIRERMGFTQTQAAIRQLRREFPQTRFTVIEKKANGAAIIETLQREIDGILAYVPKESKESRVHAASPTVESGHVHLPKLQWADDLIEECCAFPKAANDDQCFVAGTRVATRTGNVPIEEIVAGDEVLTPLGFRAVLSAGMTGHADEVVTRYGLTGTATHKVITRAGVKYLANISSQNQFDTLSLCSLTRWHVLKALNSLASPTASWAERKDIISANQRAMLAGGALRACMSQFGSLLIRRQFRLAAKYITEMGIALTTALKTYWPYKKAVIGNCTHPYPRIWSIWQKFARSRNSGTQARKAVNGTESTPKSQSASSSASVAAGVVLPQESVAPCIAPESVNGDLSTLANGIPVYNLTVDGGVYYANGVLVSNCDAMTQMILRARKTIRSVEFAM